MLSASNPLRQNKISIPKKISPGIARPLHKMSAANDLSNLQSIQHSHDEKYHQDIWCLPFNARIKHMVLHFAKYTGKFILAEESHDRSLLSAILIDTWIITLASANMLNLKLSSSLGLEKADEPNLRSVGQSLSTSDFAYYKDPHQLAVRQLGKITGCMAKACESLDHMEAFDSRGSLERGVLDVAKLCLAVSTLLDLDFISLVHTRWEEIEARSIF